MFGSLLKECYNLIRNNLIKIKKPQMPAKALKIFFILFFAFLPMIKVNAAVEYDLGIGPEDISFSKDTFFAGEKVKIYARVHNYGSKDATAYVIFYQGQTTIGDPQPISVVAGGVEDAVWVDWLAVKGKSDIVVRIVGQSPTDNQPDNDSVKAPVVIEADNDNDGVGDDSDLDDDNDGLSDTQEASAKTDAQNPDTDDDGVIDGEDAYPLDSTKSVKEDQILPPSEPSAKSETIFPNSLLGSRQNTGKKAAVKQETRAESGEPYFEFEGETAVEKQLTRDQSAGILSNQNKEAVSKEGGTNFWQNKILWLFAAIAFGWLVYFSPWLVKKLRRKRRRGYRR